MDEIIGKTFDKVSEKLDGKIYKQCTFTNCTLVYSGGDLPVMDACRFDLCQWEFSDAANRTLNFLGGLCRMGDPVTKQGLEGMFRKMLGG